MSTCVAGIDYDKASKTLVVEFVKGGSHTYNNVPLRVVKAFLAAPSEGQFFNAKIRNRY